MVKEVWQVALDLGYEIKNNSILYHDFLREVWDVKVRVPMDFLGFESGVGDYDSGRHVFYTAGKNDAELFRKMVLEKELVEAAHLDRLC